MTMKPGELDFEQSLNSKLLKNDLVFSLNGMSVDEYIAKVAKEIDEIDLSSVPIDRWDLIVAFSLGLLETAGDCFLSDPDFKYSLNNKDGDFVKWINENIHKAKIFDHSGQPLDYQGEGYGGGAHRVKSLLHGTPMAYYSYRKKAKEGEKLSAVERAWNYSLVAHDLLVSCLGIYCISTGQFIDIKFSGDGIEFVCSSTNQYGNPYSTCNVFVAIVKYVIHMLADFFSAEGLVIPGFELLTRVSDSKIEKWATTLYDNGMNLRTMTLQKAVSFAIEKLMSLYVWIRKEGCDEQYSDAAWEHKQHKLLLLTHLITTGVNVGKVIVSEAPWRLNLVVIGRTVQLLWRVVAEEAALTNRHIEAADRGVLLARLESTKTLMLINEAVHECDNVETLMSELRQRGDLTVNNVRQTVSDVQEAYAKMISVIGE